MCDLCNKCASCCCCCCCYCCCCITMLQSQIQTSASSSLPSPSLQVATASEASCSGHHLAGVYGAGEGQEDESDVAAPLAHCWLLLFARAPVAAPVSRCPRLYCPLVSNMCTSLCCLFAKVFFKEFSYKHKSLVTYLPCSSNRLRGGREGCVCRVSGPQHTI